MLGEPGIQQTEEPSGSAQTLAPRAMGGLAPSCCPQRWGRSQCHTPGGQKQQRQASSCFPTLHPRTHLPAQPWGSEPQAHALADRRVPNSRLQIGQMGGALSGRVGGWVLGTSPGHSQEPRWALPRPRGLQAVKHRATPAQGQLRSLGPGLSTCLRQPQARSPLPPCQCCWAVPTPQTRPNSPLAGWRRSGTLAWHRGGWQDLPSATPAPCSSWLGPGLAEGSVQPSPRSQRPPRACSRPAAAGAGESGAASPGRAVGRGRAPQERAGLRGRQARLGPGRGRSRQRRQRSRQARSAEPGPAGDPQPRSRPQRAEPGRRPEHPRSLAGPRARRLRAGPGRAVPGVARVPVDAVPEAAHRPEPPPQQRPPEQEPQQQRRAHRSGRVGRRARGCRAGDWPTGGRAGGEGPGGGQGRPRPQLQLRANQRPERSHPEQSSPSPSLTLWGPSAPAPVNSSRTPGTGGFGAYPGGGAALSDPPTAKPSRPGRSHCEPKRACSARGP